MPSAADIQRKLIVTEEDEVNRWSSERRDRACYCPQPLREARLLAIDSYPQPRIGFTEKAPGVPDMEAWGLVFLYSYVFVQDLLSCLSGYEVLYLTAEGYECNRSGDEDRRESTEYYTENHREREAAYAVTTEDEDAEEHEER